jgi:hypothetical protein
MPRVMEAGQVIIHGIPLRLVPGTYVMGEAERFGDKISTGDLRYADFSPDENGFPTTSCHGGYGLRRYSDLNSSETALTMYLEADGVECFEAGHIYLSPLQIDETLPWEEGDTQGPPVWIGVVNDSGTRKLACVAGDVLFERDGTNHPGRGTWTRNARLAGTAIQGAVGVFGNKLIIGYGAAATAQYTSDLTTLGDLLDDATEPAKLYVWAVTADCAASYIAGGTTTSDHYKVMSSSDGATDYTGSTECGSFSTEITSLAPGGLVAIVFVGKEEELGCIDGNGVYRSLIPLDSTLSTNCRGMRWWMGAGGTEQRGPVVIFFPRDRGIWAFQPTSTTSGNASNITPWANPGVRPLNVRGQATALQGSARWLYYAIQNGDGDSWIVRRDARSGATHNFLTVGKGTDCRALGIVSIYGGNPMFFFGKGNGVSYVILPLDGESPLSDPACRFAPTGIVTLPDADLNLPDENKVLYSHRLVLEGMGSGCTVQVQINTDGGDYSSIGTASSGTFYEASHISGVSCKRWGRQFVLSTTDPERTPIIRAIVTRAYLNTRLLRQWAFEAYLPAGYLNNLTEDTADPYVTQRTLWNDRASGIPTTFTDAWGDTWNVKVKGIQEKETERPAETGFEGDTPVIERRIALLLLETKRTGGNIQWGSFKWGSPYAQWR